MTSPSHYRIYTGPSAQEIASRLPGSSRPDHHNRVRLRGWCHGHGDRRTSASVVVQDRQHGDGLSVKCWVGCDRRTIILALEEATGIPIWDAWESTSVGLSRRPQVGLPRQTPTRGESTPKTTSETEYDATPWYVRRWAATTPIPMNPHHPARRWMAARNLWRFALPAPGPLRWEQPTQEHMGVGSIAALIALPDAWTMAWPSLPYPQAYHRIAIAQDGTPALDKAEEAGGLNKRSCGPTTDGVVVIGCPILADALEPVFVTEGVADALALASRYVAPVVATVGTAAMYSTMLANWLATAPHGVVVHADNDVGKAGRPPPGRAAARALCRAVEECGGRARAVFAYTGKDPADAAQSTPFGAIADGWIDYARTMVETTDWPKWEIARQATVIFTDDCEVKI